MSHLCSYAHCRSIHHSQKRKITDVPLTDEWSKEIHSNYMEYYPVLKGNEVLTFVKIMIEMGTKLLKGKCHTQKDKCHMKPSIVNLTKFKSRISRGCGEWGVVGGGMINGNLRAGSFNVLFFGRITSYDNVLCLFLEPEKLSRSSHSIFGSFRTLRR